MTKNERLAALKVLLFGDASDTSRNAELTVYLDLTCQEILTFKYKMVGGVPSDVTDVPLEDEITQVNACAMGFSHKGGQGETRHNENGIDRTWRYADMVDYVHDHVIAYAGVG